MRIFVVLPGIVGTFVSLALAVYILQLNPKARANKLFAALAALQATLLFLGVRLQLAPDGSHAFFWHRLSFAWPLTIAMGYQLGLVLTNQEKQLFHRVSTVANYVIAFGFALVGWYEHSLLGSIIPTEWGWEYHLDPNDTYYLMSVVWKYSVFVVIIAYCSVYALRTRNPYRRSRALTYLAGFLFPSLFGHVTRLLFPLVGFPSVPLANIGTVIGSALVALSIHRSRAFMIDPAMAARTVFDSVQDGIILLDEHLAVTEANTGAGDLLGTGRKSLVGQPIESLVPLPGQSTGPGELEHLDINREVDIEDKHLSFRITPLLYRGYAFGAVCVIKDLSRRAAWEAERRESRERLFQKQKLESIGTLAGGIAHDFNNALGGVLLAAEELRAHASENDRATTRALDTIIHAAAHAEDLTSRLLEFARKDQEGFALVDLGEVIDKVRSLCRHTFGSLIKLDVNLNPEFSPLVVRGNSQALQSVFLNLCINARDALGGQGTIHVDVEVLEEDRTQARSRVQGLESPATVRVDVRDEGVGMDDQVRSRIFDPFFTTKAVGEGTGLGLSMAYGTIRAHNGRIEVESTPGKGSSFRVYLPLAE